MTLARRRLLQLAALAAMGCDMAQGYHIARPMPEDALVRFLDQADAGRMRTASA